MKKKILKLLQYISLFWVFNFFTFSILTLYIGGDAINGFIQNGAYYVANHGRYTEVSKIIWYINKFQGLILIFSTP
ncbi:MAG: hypothetical protein ACOCRK_10395 [bacterium]